MTTAPKITPMLQQYLEIKEQHKDTILFYRMGDFYEMFFDDAITASKVLGITLTSRSGKDEVNKVPMCGVPFHAVSGYLGKMVRAGYRVALCEQTEDPKQAKGIVKRGVVRIVTPGVTTDDQILDEKNNCYVCSLYLQKAKGPSQVVGLSFIDVSTGTFQITEKVIDQDDFSSLTDIITLLHPAEVILPEKLQQASQDLLANLTTMLGTLCITPRPDHHFERNHSRTTLTEHFKTTSLAGFGCDNMESGSRAAGALLTYIQDTQKTDCSFIKHLSPFSDNGFLIIDESSRRNLELTETIIGGKREGSLLATLDQTNTPMGARLLRKRLLFPLQDRQAIIERLNAIEDLISQPALRLELRTLLGAVYDLERLCSRLVLGHGNARDMSAVKLSLAQLPQLGILLGQFQSPLLQKIVQQLDLLGDLHTLIDQAIRDDAPISLREGKLIAEGYNEELDGLIYLLRDGKQLILNLENKEREQSGISKLKVGYNKVFGYFFEVSKLQAEKIPEYFIRKQTLVNAERFITPELKELEESISSAQEKRLDLEYRLFAEIRERLADQSERILDTAHQIARIDFLTSLAETAYKFHYRKPVITEEQEITISEGRHPVIERSLEPGRFVPNDVHLNQKDAELLIITGPNMAGKSTVLRQTALIVLMAHIGSFVPADQAEICIVDRIFTRVGAMDDLRRGQSTFMVEMNETANILNNATEKSLVILDEIGRGTSTYDGLAIAWAVTEALVQKNNIGIKTLFATHYHELTELATTQERIQNYSIAVREWNDTIIFLHKLVKGATNRSYGIQVASLAGVPEEVISRANTILKAIEQEHGQFKGEQGQQAPTNQPCQLPLFHTQTDSPLKEFLKKIDPDTITPREAQQILYQIFDLIK